MAYSPFEDLEVWRKACKLAVRIYEALDKCKDYSLKDQMTRAAVSIASNIAEGLSGAQKQILSDFSTFQKVQQQSCGHRSISLIR